MICQKCSYKLNDDWQCCPKCGLIAQTLPAPEPSKANKNYGAGVRAQVLEVIVRQAIAGAPWQEICQGPMAVNNITVEEVEEAVRRRGGGGSSFTAVPRKPKSPSGGSNFAVAATPGKKLNVITKALSSLLKILPQADKNDLETGEKIVADLKALEAEIETTNQSPWYQASEASLQSDLERELAKRPPHNPNSGGPHPIN